MRMGGVMGRRGFGRVMSYMYVEDRLWFSHIVELWFWCLQGPSLSLG